MPQRRSLAKRSNRPVHLARHPLKSALLWKQMTTTERLLSHLSSRLIPLFLRALLLAEILPLKVLEAEAGAALRQGRTSEGKYLAAVWQKYEVSLSDDGVWPRLLEGHELIGRLLVRKSVRRAGDLGTEMVGEESPYRSRHSESLRTRLDVALRSWDRGVHLLRKCAVQVQRHRINVTPFPPWATIFHFAGDKLRYQ